MLTPDPTPLSSAACSVLAGADVWFLSGPMHLDDSIKHIAVDQSPFVIGRNAGNSLKLGFKTVSGRHATLAVREGRLYLTDMGSTNGTFVNGKKVAGCVELKQEDLVQFADAPFRVRCQSPTSHVAGTIAKNVCDEALALVQFDRLMNQRLVRPHFQPIVEMDTSTPVGFEILGRSDLFGLESIGAMFQAAEQLNLEVELSRLLRWEGIRVGRDVGDQPILFVNTHPKEMEDSDGLLKSLEQVRTISDSVKLVLEIHEASVTNTKLMQELSACLSDLRMQLAFDDFGSGQARLAQLIEAKPDYVKFDISLIRGIDQADGPRKKMLQTLVQMVRDLDTQVLAEGVETQPEAETCRDMGFDLAQGYFFGRPSPI